MRKTLAITFILIAAGYSSAQACSIMPPPAITESHYEERLEPLLKASHREFVNEADHILIGKFKFSNSKKAHRLKISDILKTSSIQKPKKSVSVKFKAIDDDRITYIKKGEETYGGPLSRWNEPNPFYFGIEGTYGPGDCGISLEIISETKYLIFANENFEITSMLSINDRILPLQNAIEAMIANPRDKFGISRSMQQVLKRGTKVRLLETESCRPVPFYKVLASTSNDDGEIRKAKPILVFDTTQTKTEWELGQDELEAARNLGLIQGRYTNAPELSSCVVGQRYLSLGDIDYRDLPDDLGQMIPEQSGYFNLDETIFEHHITPRLISLDNITTLLTTHHSK